MRKDVTLALNYALNKGFQIHPDALKILENIDVKQLEKIIKDVVREKTRRKLYHINQDDLETYLGIKEDVSIKNEAKVLFDPTPKVTTAEGVSGYNSLFASRFLKLKKIISNRPESRMLKTISAVKSAKSEDDMYLCGLVTARTIERNISKLILEDPSGSVEAIIFDVDLQKTAATLLNDQFVMARVSMGKNSGFIVKDLILPDIPDHVPNHSESDAYAVFLSDLHIGSKYFLENEFSEFID